MALYLLEGGADILARNNEGKNVMMLSKNKEFKKAMIEIYKKRKAKLNNLLGINKGNDFRL